MAASVTCPKLHWFPSNYIHPYQPSLSTGPKVGAMKNENTLGIPNTMAREAEEQHVSFTSADVDCELFIESLMSMYIYIYSYICILQIYIKRDWTEIKTWRNMCSNLSGTAIFRKVPMIRCSQVLLLVLHPTTTAYAEWCSDASASKPSMSLLKDTLESSEVMKLNVA